MTDRFAVTSVRMPYPLPVGGGLPTRTIAFVEVNGCVAEISPLPGLHTESLEESLCDLKTGALKTPTAQFAHSVLMAQGRQDAWVKGDVNRPLPRMNGLVAGAVDDLVSHEVIKVKIGRKPNEDVQRLQTVLRQSPNCRLRLDGNRLLTLDQVLDVVGSIPLDRIEYVEEPLIDSTQLPELAKVVPVALDESLHDPAASRHADASGTWFHVIKPTRLGSISSLVQEVELAQSMDREVVLTSCFESPWTLGVLCRIAESLGLHKAQGLGTADLFQGWPAINVTSDLSEVDLPSLDWKPWI